MSWLSEMARSKEIVQELQAKGVLFLDPNAVYIGEKVTVGEGTVLLPGTILRGQTAIGKNCEIGPNTMLVDCTVGDEVTVNASQAFESVMEDRSTVGPFAHLRPHTHLGRGAKAGAFVETKNSDIGPDTKISHLTYVGDSDVGSQVNFGCGTVTVNYDGKVKSRTVIGDKAFIGCNVNLVAPVKVGDGAYIAAGSTVTDDVPPAALTIARSRQTNKEGRAKGRTKHT